MRIMIIGGWYIILEVYWIFEFSPISFDSKQFKVSLSTNYETILLEGGVENSILKLMNRKAVRECGEEELKTKVMCSIYSNYSNNGTLLDKFSKLLSQFF